MSRSDRVALSSIKSLTLYAGKPTKARRTAAVPQLECTGVVCRRYQPSAVHCTNVGGTDIDVDWKCEADLPSSLRFDRLDVSCEGWDRPGDPYVLKGSCGLTYSLVWTPQHQPTAGTDYTYYILALILIAIFFWINRSFLRFLNPFTSTRGGNGGGGGRGSGPTSSNWGSGGRGTGGTGAPPPPYTKYPSDSNNRNQPWTPGFWTGLGAGGLATSIYHYLTRPRYSPTYTQQPPPPTWDWERPFAGTRTSGAAMPEFSAARRRFNTDDDGGFGRAGSSTGAGTQLGEMRRATGFGGSSVR